MPMHFLNFPHFLTSILYQNNSIIRFPICPCMPLLMGTASPLFSITSVQFIRRTSQRLTINECKRPLYNYTFNFTTEIKPSRH